MTIPAIPDNLYKILLLFGSIVLFYFYLFKFEPVSQQKKRITEDYNQNFDSLSLLIDSYDQKILNTKKQEDILSLEIDSLIKLLPNGTVYVTQEELKVIHSDQDVIRSKTKQLEIKYKEEIKLNRNQNGVYKKINQLNMDYSTRYDQYQDDLDFYLLIILFGGTIALVGLLGITKHQRIQDEILERQLGEKDKVFTYCQSCARRFNSALFKGTKIDNTESKSFCIDCFKNGEFIEKDLTYAEMERRTLENYIHSNNHQKKSKLIKRLKNLDRWALNKYD